jgi:hypothetical protein
VGHVALATFTWVALLWCVGAAGRIAPRGAAAQLRQLDGAHADGSAEFDAVTLR